MVRKSAKATKAREFVKTADDLMAQSEKTATKAESAVDELEKLALLIEAETQAKQAILFTEMAKESVKKG